MSAEIQTTDASTFAFWTTIVTAILVASPMIAIVAAGLVMEVFR